MPRPAEHKTVQARIITYAQEPGWEYSPGLAAIHNAPAGWAASSSAERSRSWTRIWAVMSLCSVVLKSSCSERFFDS